MQRIYNKYGEDFIFSKIEECPKEKLTEREMYWIKKIKPLCNMQIPSVSTHFTITEESRLKMSIATKSRMTDEMKQKISQKTKEAMNRPDVRERFLAGQKNKDYKEPWNKGLKGLKICKGKKVFCKELNMVFDSACDAGRYLGAKNGKGVSRVCLGQRNSYKNLKFEYIDK